MIKTATVPLRGVRTNALVVPINFVGIDLTSATVTAVVLQDWDNDPADPELALTETPNGNGSGVVVGTITTTGGVTTSPVTLTIGATDMAAFPDAPEVGGNVNWVWYLMIQTNGSDANTKQRYIEGDFIIGGAMSGGTGSVTATIANEEVNITIDGVAAIAPLVASAQSAADDAETAQAAAEAAQEAAEAAAAGVPVGDEFLILTAPPGDNRGQVGDTAFNSTDRVLYPKKTTEGWTGLKLSDGSTVTNDGQIDDLALGTLPSGFTTTRSQSTTNLLAGDTGTTYSTISSGTAVQHPRLGLLSYPQSEQFASDPTGPGDGAVALAKSFAVGKVCVRIHGNGTLTSSAGTATGSGYGAITEASGVQTITLTTTGTIAFSLSGSDANTKVQIEQSPLFPTATVPTPFMPTAGTRDADRIANTGDLLTALGAGEGTIIMNVHIPVNKTNNTILGVNTNTGLLQAPTDQQIQWFDGTNYDFHHLGVGDFRNGARVGFTWRSGRIAFMGGSHLPEQFAATLLTITSARLGLQAGTTDIYGQTSLAGGIGRYQLIDRATVTSGGDALEFYDLVSEISRPTVADFQNWETADPLPVFRGKVAQLAAGTITSAPIVCTGPSHTAGVTTFANSWPKKLADALATAGYAAHSRAFFGTNGASWSAGTNTHDGRATYTGTAPSLYGKSLGGECISIPSGTALTLTWAESADKVIVVYYTDTGLGSFQVSAGAGAITPDEGGSSTVSTNAAIGIAYKTFTKSGGATAWTITASSAAVRIAGIYDPNGIPVINGGRNGFTAVDMSSGSLIAQSSYLLPLSIIAPALTIMAPDNTNSASGAVALATYRSAVQTQLDYAIGRGGDVIVLTDPMSAPQVIPEGTQQVYAGIVAQEAKRKDLPLFHLRKWEEQWGYTAVHNSGFYSEATITAGLHFGTTANNWMIALPLSAAIVSALS